MKSTKWTKKMQHEHDETFDEQFKKELNEILKSCSSNEVRAKFLMSAFGKHLKKCFRNSNLIEGIDDLISDLLMEPAFELLLLDDFLSKKNICEAHATVTCQQKDLPADCKGIYRNIEVTVGGRVCPNPFMVKELMHNWILDMQDWKNQDPKKMHIRFEKIHPFRDGNGRVGRLLMWWHELKLDRLPALIENEKKQDYYKWFS